MQIDVVERGNVSIVTVSDEMGMFDKPEKFYLAVKDLVEKGRTRFIADINVSGIDSIGLGILVQSFDVARRHGGRMVFVTRTKQVQKVIKNTGLDKLFSFYDSVDAAMEALEAGSAAAQ